MQGVWIVPNSRSRKGIRGNADLMTVMRGNSHLPELKIMVKHVELINVRVCKNFWKMELASIVDHFQKHREMGNNADLTAAQTDKDSWMMVPAQTAKITKN
jgi:hypothetical protein